MNKLFKKTILSTCFVLAMLMCFVFAISQNIFAEEISYDAHFDINITPKIKYNVEKKDITVTVENNSDLQVEAWELYDAAKKPTTKIDSAGTYYIGAVFSVNKTGDYYFNMGGMMGCYLGGYDVVDDNGQPWDVSACYSYNLANCSTTSGDAENNSKLFVLIRYTGKSIIYENNVDDDSVSNMPEDTNTYIEGTPVTISTQTPTRDGYDFVGWNTDKDAKTALTFTNGKYTIGTSDVTLYAIWGHAHDGVVFDRELTNANLSTYVTYDNTTNGYYLEEGNYYLGENLNLNNTIRISETVNLCFNGFIIDAKNVPTVNASQEALADSGAAIRITVETGNGGVLNLFDCGETINKFSEDQNGKWILNNELSKEAVKHTINGGGIVNAPVNGVWIEIGKLNLYGGTISGNKRGVTIQQTASALSLFNDATIIGNKNSNLMISVNSYNFPPDFIKIDVSDNFTGKVGITLKDLSYSPIEEQYGVFSTSNNVDLHENFYSDLEEYDIIYNSNKCLEVTESATVQIVNQKGTILKTINDVYSGHDITLPSELKKGYDFTEYYYYESIFKYTVDKGGILTIPKKNTVINADLFITFTKEPTAESFSVETEAKNVNYQWYERVKNDIPVAFSNGGSDSSYWASNGDAVVRGRVYHVTFPNGIPEGLNFDTGTVTKTGENTYDVTPGFIWGVGFAISISATEPINVVATYDEFVENLLEGETSSTLSKPKYDKTYFCRVTDDEGIFTDSNYATREFSIDEAPQEFTYGDADVGFVVKGTDLTNFVIEYYIDGEWTTNVPTNKGSYNVKITRAKDDEYKAISLEIENGVVIKAKDIIVTAEDKTMYLGDSLPVLTAKVEGLAGTDTINYSFKEINAEQVGVYSIVPIGDSEQANYVVQYVQGTLSVKAKSDSPSVDINSLQRIFNAYCENQNYVEKKLDVEMRISEDVSQLDKSLIAQKIGSNSKLIYKNAELFLIVDNGETKEEINIGDENNELIAITYSFDFTKKKNVQIFRVHNGIVEELTTTANEDGETAKCDKKSNTITVNAKRYSAYAFVYQDDVEVASTDYVVVNTSVEAHNPTLKLVTFVSLITIVGSVVIKKKNY